MKPKAERWCSDDEVKAFVESYWPRNLSYFLVCGKRCIRERDASCCTLPSVFRNRPFGDWNSILSNKNKKVAAFFSFQQNMSFRTRILFLSPLLLYLLIILIGNKGVHGSSTVDLVLILLTQTLVIAFVEEMVFRGFMLNLLLSKSYKVAVLLSSFLFAFTHSLNMLNGQSVANTIFQILFAFVVGLVLALLIVNGQSIGVTIVFHGLNNFFQFTSPVEANDSLLINYALLLFLSGYALYLWNRKSTLSVSRNQVSG